MHAADCIHCHTEPAEGNCRFLVKNAVTRESRHVLAADSDAAIRAVGWSKWDVLYTLIVQMSRAPVNPVNRVMARERLIAMRVEREESLRELHNDRALNGVASSSSRLVDGREKKEIDMPKKKSKRKTKARTAKGADSFLSARFTRKHGGVDHFFERDGDAWRLDGKGPMTLRQAMAELLGEEPAKHRSFVQFFAVDKIAAPGAAKTKPRKAEKKVEAKAEAKAA